MTRPPLQKSAWSLLWISVLVIILDQWTKSLITQHMQWDELHTVLPVLDITRTHNEGAAFSFLIHASGWQRWMFTFLAIGVSAVLLGWLRGMQKSWRPLPVALCLIIGGALGNAIDRLRLGYVVDFIAAHWDQHYFPAFNVADSAISVGAVLLFLDAWVSRDNQT